MKISREEAEKLIDTSQVLSTSVDQQSKQIKVRMQLANDQTCVVTYDRKTHEKSYQIDK
jgi:hypothetical protein